MQSHDIIIKITKEGKVEAEIRGAKGKACLQYAKLLESIVGKTVQQELTAEYYEPDSAVIIEPTLEQKQEN